MTGAVSVDVQKKDLFTTQERFFENILPNSPALRRGIRTILDIVTVMR